MESKGPYYDEILESSYFLYRCWNCALKVEDGVKNEAEAMAFILVNSSAHKKRKERNDSFKDAFERAAEDFPRVTSRQRL